MVFYKDLKMVADVKIKRTGLEVVFEDGGSIMLGGSYLEFLALFKKIAVKYIQKLSGDKKCH